MYDLIAAIRFASQRKRPVRKSGADINIGISGAVFAVNVVDGKSKHHPQREQLRGVHMARKLQAGVCFLYVVGIIRQLSERTIIIKAMTVII